MVKHITTSNTIDQETEIHYSILTTIDPTEYPQVHDFYELILTLDGSMELEVNTTTFVLPHSTLFLIRPDDIHTKHIPTTCSHINLAFPKTIVDDLFRYLCIDSSKSDFLEKTTLFPIYLTKEKKDELCLKFEDLNLLPLHNKTLAKSHLRLIVMDIITKHFVLTQNLLSPPNQHLPEWFNQFLGKVHKKEVFCQTNSAILSLSDKTQEHLCRVFKKHLNMTPTQYLNDLRLNYAANLLIHTDQPIIDIAFMSGFQSLSYFYHLFQEKYKISPSKFRKKSPTHS